MLYRDMLGQVMLGKVAFRLSVNGMEVSRSNDTIIRTTFHKNEICQVFIATPEEITASDWVIRTDDQEEDNLSDIWNYIAISSTSTPTSLRVSNYAHQ